MIVKFVQLVHIWMLVMEQMHRNMMKMVMLKRLMKMMGTSLLRRIWRHRSMPLVPGSMTSSTTKSTGPASKATHISGPEEAGRT